MCGLEVGSGKLKVGSGKLEEGSYELEHNLLPSFFKLYKLLNFFKLPTPVFHLLTPFFVSLRF